MILNWLGREVVALAEPFVELAVDDACTDVGTGRREFTRMERPTRHLAAVL